jgi:hypothetical protein
VQLNDLTNRVFGDFTILSRAEDAIQPSGQKKVMWVAKCNHCNFIKKVAACNLQQGLAKRCTCQVTERAEKNFASFWLEFEKSYRYNAANRKLPWILTTEQFKELTQQNCHYCNQEPQLRKAHHRSRCMVKINGIDRKDSSIGYNMDNCIPCCFTCNRMKMNMMYNTFIKHVTQISSHINME